MPQSSALQPLRIAILHHAFDPRLNYLESVFARTLHRMGHEVVVFTTTSHIVRAERNWEGIDAQFPFKIVRSARYICYSSTIIPLDWTIPKKILEFDPQVAFLLAAHHGVGYFWMKYLPSACRVITGYSDLPWYPHSRVFWKLFKTRWLRAVLERAQQVWTTTPLTEGVLRAICPNLPASKVKFIGHGFDPEVFDARPVEATARVGNFRRAVSHMVASITATNDRKHLDEMFDGVAAFLRKHSDFGFVFAGFRGDSFSVSLRQRIEQSDVADRCLILPMIEAAEMKSIFQLSVCSVWTQVSIGIHQSLASGCPVLLRRGEPLEHLLRVGVNAMIYDEFHDISEVLDVAVVHPWSKSDVLESIAPYTSDRQLALGLSEVIVLPVS